MIRPLVRAAQPQHPVSIESGHPLTRGLVFAGYAAGGAFYDAISGQRAAVSNNYSPRVFRNGVVSAVGGITGAAFANQTGADTIAGPYSLLVVGSLETNSGTAAAFESAESGSGNGFRLYFDDSALTLNGAYLWCNNGNRTFSGGLGANSEQFTHAVILTSDGANDRWYINGVLNKTSANTILPTANAARRTRIAATYGGASSASCAMVLVWNRVLTDAEAGAAWRNPAAVLPAPRRRRRVIAVSGSPTGTVAYTNANDTSSASGTTTVVGTSAKTNAADTSSASGSVGGAVSGTSATNNAADTSSASGTTTVTATVGRTNASDTSTASGWAGSISGTVAASNDADYSAARGSAGSAQTTTGGWEYLNPRVRTADEIQKDRERLGVVLPSMAISAAKSAKQAIADRKPEERALRDAVEALRAEVGKKEAALLRSQYVSLVRLEIELELLRQRQEEEEAVAMLMIQLMAA